MSDYLYLRFEILEPRDQQMRALLQLWALEMEVLNILLQRNVAIVILVHEREDFVAISGIRLLALARPWMFESAAGDAVFSFASRLTL